LRRITEATEGTRGGEMLGRLWDMGGGARDEVEWEIVRSVLRRGSKTWWEIMRGWVGRGELVDRYGEFFVKDGGGRRDVGMEFNSDWWEGRWKVRTEHFPSFLNGLEVDMVVRTGKYLNVMRSMGWRGEGTGILEQGMKEGMIEVDLGEGGGRRGRLRETFENLFRKASGMVLDLVVRREGLMDTLTEIKRWFLIEQGDYFVMFMDLAGDMLKGSVRDIKLGRVQSLLSMSVQTSGGGGEGVRAGFKEYR